MGAFLDHTTRKALKTDRRCLCIADLGVDSLVMGRHGHSRMREIMRGCMTRDILRHMTVLVLFSR